MAGALQAQSPQQVEGFASIIHDPARQQPSGGRADGFSRRRRQDT